MKQRAYRYANQKNRGFTLLELVVATAVSVVVVVMIIRVASAMLQQAERSVGAMSQTAEVEIARQYLESDIQSAFVPEDWRGSLSVKLPGEGWGIEGWDSVPHDVKPTDRVIDLNVGVDDSLLNERWGKEGVQAIWLVNDPPKGLNDPGGIKVVSYQLKRKRLSASAFPRYYLMRSESSAAESFRHGYKLEDSAYDQGSYSDKAFWSASVIRHPTLNHIVATNVIDFGIRGFSKDAVSGQFRLVFPDEGSSTGVGEAAEIWVVFLRVLSDQGAEMIENIEQGRTSHDWWNTAIGYSKVVTFNVVAP